MNYKSLIDKVYKQYIGEINTDELNEFFEDWVNKNKYILPKRIRMLQDMAYNSEGDIVPVVDESETEIYYYDSCHRYCFLYKEDEGLDFEYTNN